MPIIPNFEKSCPLIEQPTRPLKQSGESGIDCARANLQQGDRRVLAHNRNLPWTSILHRGTLKKNLHLFT